MAQEPSFKVYAVAALLVVSVIAVGFAYEGVPEGHVGVEKRMGAVTGDMHDPGANFVMPFVENVQSVEVRPRTYTMADTKGEGKKKDRQDAIEAPTKEGVNPRIDVTVRYHLDRDRAPDFVRDWHSLDQVEQRLIRPAVRSAIRDEAGAIPTDKIYTQEGRQRLEKAANQALRKELGDEAIVLEAVQIRNVALPANYQTSVNKKQIAQQNVQKAKARKKQSIIEAEARAEQKIIRANSDAEARVTRAQAKAKANRLVAESLSQELIQYRYAQGVGKSDTVYFFGNSTGGPMLTKGVEEEDEGGS